MTNRERITAAIRHEETDFTPHHVFFTSDMLAKMINYTGDENYINTINNHMSKATLRKPPVPVQGRPECFFDEFGVIWDKSGVDKDIGVVASKIINDVEELAAFTPPPVDEEFIHNQCRELMKVKGDNFTIASVGFTLYERAWSLCGIEDFLCYMITEPEAVKSLMSKLTQYNIQKAKIALEYDFDCVFYGDDWGQQRGLIMGKPLWTSLIKPYVAEMYAVVKNAGRFTAQHSCGDLREILDDLVEIGLDVYQTFQPEIYDLQTYKEKLGGRLTIWGGISTQIHLPFKSPDEIYDITKNTMRILGKGGGYIAAPTHEVPGDVPPENINAMIRAFKDQ